MRKPRLSGTTRASGGGQLSNAELKQALATMLTLPGIEAAEDINLTARPDALVLSVRGDIGDTSVALLPGVARMLAHFIHEHYA